MYIYIYIIHTIRKNKTTNIYIYTNDIIMHNNGPATYEDFQKLLTQRWTLHIFWISYTQTIFINKLVGGEAHFQLAKPFVH